MKQQEVVGRKSDGFILDVGPLQVRFTVLCKKVVASENQKLRPIPPNTNLYDALCNAFIPQ
jgi:hypothetical protein